MVSPKKNIEIQNAELGYTGPAGRRSVLKNVNLDFSPSEITGIIGLNGTGKSTLLRSISGLLPLISGRILINNIPLHDLSKEQLSREISIVLTEKLGGFNLTVFDVVASGQMPYTDSFHRLKKENLAVINSALERCDLISYSNRPISELSDGLFQKTIIAKALAQQTPAMLFDEPTAYLDYASKHALFLLLRDLAHKESKCVVVSSHDLDLLLKYCDRLVIISEGSIEVISPGQALASISFKNVSGGFL